MTEEGAPAGNGADHDEVTVPPVEPMLDFDLSSETSGAREARGPATSSRDRSHERGSRRSGMTGLGSKLTPGDELELRVAHVWMVEGAFTRRAINLRYADAGETKDITDVDLLAIDFDGALRTTLTIGEAKGGTGKSAPSPLDRSMWLRGLRELTRAHRAELTMAQRQTSRARRLASELGVDLQAVPDLEAREIASGAGSMREIGPHAPSVALAREAARQAISSDPDLNRAYQYLRGDVWFAEPWAAAKRLVATVKLLGARWAPAAGGAEQEAIRWMTAETVIAFTLVSTRLAGTMLTTDPGRLVREVGDKLAEGAAPMSEMKQLSESIDRYLSSVLDRHGVPRAEIVSALGAFQPSPPMWAEAFAELLKRLGTGARDARGLPRYADLVVTEHLVRRRSLEAPVLIAFGYSEPEGARRLLRTTLAFLEGQAGLPREVVSEIVDRR